MTRSRAVAGGARASGGARVSGVARVFGVALALGGAALVAGCAPERPELGAAPEPMAATAALGEVRADGPTPSAAPASPPTEELVVVAEAVVDAVPVYANRHGGTPTVVLDRSAEVSGTLVFVVVGEAPDRLEVLLPVRPNGSTGWIERDAVALSQHGYRIEVELGAHRLRVLHLGEVLMETSIGTGTIDTPTPGGVFYVKELLRPPDPTGPYGSYAYGLSGFSTVLESFNGGTGVIGIHGTDDPASLGTRTSHGCIRLHNDDIERLVEEIGLPLGTPVAILD